MCEAVGHPVRRLVRTRIGPAADRALAPGEWRELTLDEVRALERAAATRSPSPGAPGAPGRHEGILPARLVRGVMAGPADRPRCDLRESLTRTASGPRSSAPG